MQRDGDWIIFQPERTSGLIRAPLLGACRREQNHHKRGDFLNSRRAPLEPPVEPFTPDFI
jgi:hypothetical protein